MGINVVTLSGLIEDGLTYSHNAAGEKIYTLKLRVERLSGEKDLIPVLVSEKIIDEKQEYTGKFVEISGLISSYNKHSNGENSVILNVFAKRIKFLDYLAKNENVNSVFLGGYVCKKPVCRKTTRGKDVSDLILASNRRYGSCDYIPCISWYEDAKHVGNLEVGTKIILTGRLQSREYIKKLEEGKQEKRVTYEVAIKMIDVAEGGDENECKN